MENFITPKAAVRNKRVPNE